MTKGRPVGSFAKEKMVTVHIRFPRADLTELDEYGLKIKHWNRAEFIRNATNDERKRREKK